MRYRTRYRRHRRLCPWRIRLRSSLHLLCGRSASLATRCRYLLSAAYRSLNPGSDTQNIVQRGLNPRCMATIVESGGQARRLECEGQDTPGQRPNLSIRLDESRCGPRLRLNCRHHFVPTLTDD